MRGPTSTAAHRVALAAMVVGLGYAAFSVYWGLGGTWLLSTVGLAHRYDDAGALAAVWAAAGVKAVAALLPPWGVKRVSARRSRRRRRRSLEATVAWQRRVRLLTWIEGVVLTGYGLVLTGAGVLVRTGVLHSARNADHRALVWHACLWDPWFLVWGVLVLVALVLATRSAPS
ncbi:MAG: DUF3995 domain-containing protein [Solirubrobacterales bacterium]|nr:DUF3995 domain-containing protein [Solirubrobacterales bacterium]